MTDKNKYVLIEDPMTVAPDAILSTPAVLASF